MDAKELLSIVNANGFHAKGLYLLEAMEGEGYSLITYDYEAKEVADGVTLVDYRGEGPYITPFALLVKEADSYALYIDEADKDLI